MRRKFFTTGEREEDCLERAEEEGPAYVGHKQFSPVGVAVGSLESAAELAGYGGACGCSLPTAQLSQ